MTASAFVYVSPSTYQLLIVAFCIRLDHVHIDLVVVLHAVALLLLIGNIEPNPVPQCHRTISFGLLNARFSVNKAALIHDLKGDHRLDVAAVTETWMLSDDLGAIKLYIAPVGYNVLHACRGSSAAKHHEGGVAISIATRSTCQRSIKVGSLSSNICQ